MILLSRRRLEDLFVSLIYHTAWSHKPTASLSSFSESFVLRAAVPLRLLQHSPFYPPIFDHTSTAYPLLFGKRYTSREEAKVKAISYTSCLQWPRTPCNASVSYSHLVNKLALHVGGMWSMKTCTETSEIWFYCNKYGLKKNSVAFRIMEVFFALKQKVVTHLVLSSPSGTRTNKLFILCPLHWFSHAGIQITWWVQCRHPASTLPTPITLGYNV